MLEDIQATGYTLMVDENVEVLESFEIHPDDLKAAVSAGWVNENNGVYTVGDEDYHGSMYREMFYLMRSRELIKINAQDQDSLFFWALPPNLITSFKDVFIMTYLFEGQSLHHFLEIYQIPYVYIGVDRDDDGTFRFGDLPGYTPEYVRHLKDMIHILDNPKLNAIGKDFYALSKAWLDRGGSNVDQLRKNVVNCYRNIWDDVPADERLWGTYKSAFGALRGKGYTNGFLTFNARATNNYRNCRALAYVVNVFMNVGEKLFYQSHGIKVDEDMYALSCMVQWIWRSAIRDGEPVDLYIPSSRMRTLLIDWINSFDKGGNANA